MLLKLAAMPLNEGSQQLLSVADAVRSVAPYEVLRLAVKYNGIPVPSKSTVLMELDYRMTTGI